MPIEARTLPHRRPSPEAPDPTPEVAAGFNLGGRGGLRVNMIADNLPPLPRQLGSLTVSALTPQQISAIDAAYIWHPYSTMGIRHWLRSWPSPPRERG